MAGIEDRFDERTSAGYLAAKENGLYQALEFAYAKYLYPVGTALLETITPPLDAIVNDFPHPDNTIVGRNNANEGLNVGYFGDFRYTQGNMEWLGKGISLYRSEPNELFAGLTVALVTRDSFYDSSHYGITQRNFHRFRHSLEGQVASRLSTADLMVVIRANSKVLNEIGLMKEMASLIIPRGAASFVRAKNATPEIEREIISKGPSVIEQSDFILDVVSLLNLARAVFEINSQRRRPRRD